MTRRTREDILKRMEEAAAALTPADFAAKAREMSGDEKAKDGGDWGYWGWQNFTPQEKTMIDNLSAGSISSPVDAGKGFSLLFVCREGPGNRRRTTTPSRPASAACWRTRQLKKLAVEKIAQALCEDQESREPQGRSGQAGRQGRRQRPADPRPGHQGHRRNGLYLAEVVHPAAKTRSPSPWNFPRASPWCA